MTNTRQLTDDLNSTRISDRFTNDLIGEKRNEDVSMG